MARYYFYAYINDMKNSALLLLVSIFFLALSACQGDQTKDGGEDKGDILYDTIVEVRIDTIITFDPNTYVETMSIQKIYDTTILMNGEKVDFKTSRSSGN